MKHKNSYYRTEKVVDITFPKAMVIMITVMTFFVIPAQVITMYRENPDRINNIVASVIDVSASDSDEGRVAGISTGTVNGASTINTESTSILQNKSFLIGGMGLFLFLLSVGGIGYLMQLDKEYQYKSSKF